MRKLKVGDTVSVKIPLLYLPIDYTSDEFEGRVVKMEKGKIFVNTPSSIIKVFDQEDGWEIVESPEKLKKSVFLHLLK